MGRIVLVVLARLGLLAACQAQPSQPAPWPTTRILVAGDSTAADYPRERVGQAGWGQALPYFLPPDVAVLNLAVNGRSTKSFIDEGKWAALVEQVGPGDLVLISFGHNDSRDDAPGRYAPAMGAFRENLLRFIAEVYDEVGQAIILSPAARRLWEGPAMVETHGLYRLAAEEAAQTGRAPFIDLSVLSLAYFETIGREETKRDYIWLTRPHWQTGEPETLEDNTHFSFVGACGVAGLIALELDRMGWSEAVRTVRPATDGLRPNAVLACAQALGGPVAGTG